MPDVTDRPISFSIGFENSKAGSDTEKLARELEDRIRASAQGDVATSLNPSGLREAPIEVRIEAGANALPAVAKTIHEFAHRHETTQFTFAKDENTFILPKIDLEDIRGAIERLNGLPGDPTIDPPKPSKHKP
jgi:hypothetical protein